MLCHEILKIQDLKSNIDIVDLFYINHFNKNKLKETLKNYKFLSIVDESYAGSSLVDILGSDIISNVKLTICNPKNNKIFLWFKKIYFDEI